MPNKHSSLGANDLGLNVGLGRDVCSKNVWWMVSQHFWFGGEASDG